ncbi:MAG TPA: class I SAM-dependent methyltransferase [Terriglobales bacterium]|jgi:2-polyprenyl-3-methyl-5-hydroxy-6-metoxy-1,4-benzoquinol methylase|nr:class I SAM-dependent methyltransferase [Terriglobales bacterium]
MSVLDIAHGGFIYPRRICQLGQTIANLLPANARVLDIGCGDGLLSSQIVKKRSDLVVQGIDVLVRNKTFIPVTEFDGAVIPYANDSFDVAILVDVLHHTDDPTVLLREAKRVSRKGIVIKDHTSNGPMADLRLRFMDWVGNSRHGVILPYNYWPLETWKAQLTRLNLEIETWVSELHLYPWWANWLFGSSLHFIASIR